jgi:hypothetical protein
MIVVCCVPINSDISLQELSVNVIGVFFREPPLSLQLTDVVAITSGHNCYSNFLNACWVYGLFDK